MSSFGMDREGRLGRLDVVLVAEVADQVRDESEDEVEETHHEVEESNDEVPDAPDNQYTNEEEEDHDR